MKTRLFEVLILAASFTVNGQSTFQLIYDSGENAELFDGLLQIEDGSYVVLGTMVNLNTWGEHVVLLGVDESGTIKWEEIIGSDTQRRESGGIVFTHDGMIAHSGYRLFGAPVGPVNSDFDFMLTKANTKGEALWERYYKFSKYVEANYDLIETSDSGFLMAGFTSATGTRQGLLMKVDRNGNLEWMNDYGNPNYSTTIYSVMEHPDGTFWGVGWMQFSMTDWDAYVVHVAADGQFIQGYNYGDAFRQDATFIQIQSNGLLIICGDNESTPEFNSRQGWMFSIDTDGKKIWERTYGGNKRDNFASGMVLLDDDGIVVAGGSTSFSLNGEYEGTFTKLTENGDSIWARTYHEGTPYSNNYIYDLIRTSDGGFAAVGSCHPYTSDGWFLKLDSFGCLVDGCEAVGTDDRYQEKPGARLSISPNPVTGTAVISVKLSFYLAGNELQFSVFDATGKRVHSEPVQAMGQHALFPFDAGRLPAGIYLCRLAYGPVEIGSGNFIKE